MINQVKLNKYKKQLNFYEGGFMPNPNNDNKANQKNPNKGTAGTNKPYDKGQGNTGKQLNPNNKGVKKK